jgi:hypothetical protein
MNPFVLKSLCVLVLIIAAIMLAYANYYRRKEIYYELLEPSISWTANTKWHRFQAVQHIIICVLPTFGVSYWIIPLGLMIIWTVFDFSYSYLTHRAGITTRGIWEFGTTSTLDRWQDKIFNGKGEIAFAVKLTLTIVGIVFFIIKV